MTGKSAKRKKMVAAANIAPAVRTPSGVEAAAENGEAASKYLNRELTWLAFNNRVLHEAMDDRTPLLERVKFLSIFTSNLDEFFMKRVGGFKRQVATGVISRSLDGRTTVQQLAAIREAVVPMLQHQAACFDSDIKPALSEAGIHLLDWEQLDAAEREEASNYFSREIYPILTPLAVDPGHPFPFLSNLSVSLGLKLATPARPEPHFARVKVPHMLPRWVRLRASQSGDTWRFVHLQQIIMHHLQDLFGEMQLLAVMPFRITRNADVERDEEDADDLLELIEEQLRARRFAHVVRLEHGPDPDPWLLKYLVEELDLSDDDIYELPSELDYIDLLPISELPLPAHRAPGWTPAVPAPLADTEIDIFSVIRSRDLLVHHPYESFSASVQRLIEAAASDPRVLAIKMTVYRTGDESPFIDTLIRAAEAGKQVACLVEVTARFDEQRNIQVAQELEKAGVHVVYGVLGLKTHCKTVLIVRRESHGLQCYCHIGTGNYHVGNAKLYTDMGLITARSPYTDDVVALFHYLTGHCRNREYQKLLVAPVNMKQQFLAMIEREIDHRRAGRPARIIAQMNSLEDRQIIGKLYEASAAGVGIDLIARGFCCLRPGVKGLSENIRVSSIIGQFLEHQRLFYFRNAAKRGPRGEFFIGSADWMSRNLHNRVEAVTPIEDQHLKNRLWQILQIQLDDQRQTWDMRGDGTYVQRQPTDDHDAEGCQAALYRLAHQHNAPRPRA